MIKKNEMPQPSNNLNQSLSFEGNVNSNVSISQSQINQQSIGITSAIQNGVSTSTQNTQNINSGQTNNYLNQQGGTINNTINDGELLKAYIGKNYEKITNQKFNIPAFFFTWCYMFYRKMFGYGLILWVAIVIIINTLLRGSLGLLFFIAIMILSGLFMNKFYISLAKKRIDKIKNANSGLSQDALIGICATKGGTSIGKVFLGLFIELGLSIILIIILLPFGILSAFSDMIKNGEINITINDNNVQIDDNNSVDNNDSGSSSIIENVSVGGYGCINSKCSVTIESSNSNSEDYVLGISNTELFNKLGDYKDYIRLDVNYTKKGSQKTIVGYKIILKSTNEDISSVKTENELRNKIGLYAIGTHTDNLTLQEIGSTGFGFDDDTSYTYTSYTFIDDKNIEYEMKYINDDGTLNLVEGNKYNVTFEVSEGTFGYDFTIKSIN